MQGLKDFPLILWESICEFLFPSRCPRCSKYVERKGAWCSSCLRAALDVRLLSLPTDAPFAEVWALGRYREGLQELIKALKYRQKQSTLPYFRTFLEAAAPHLGRLLEKNFLAVPVPLFPAKERARGFNQTELIFSPWLKEQGIDMERLLLRQRSTRPMYGLTAAERQENLREAFALAAGKEKIRGKSILLLDDIFTTGTTLEACGEVLREAGAKEITGLVLASDH